MQIPQPPAGKTFVGWKVWIGASPMYEGKFTYSDLSQLDLSWYENKASVTFQAVYEENVKTINVSFVDEDGVTSLGGGDVISTDPDRELEIADPTAPAGKTFVGWKGLDRCKPHVRGQVYLQRPVSAGPVLV